MGSPFPDSGFDQPHNQDVTKVDPKHPISLQHSWPGATSTPEGKGGVETTQQMSRSMDRRREGIYMISQSEASEKLSLVSSYEGPLTNNLANESTESTSSNSSMDKPPRGERSSTSTSGVHSTSSKIQSHDTLSSENLQSFRPINDQSLDNIESPFTMVSTHSTMSDQSVTTSGPTDSTLPMPYLHLYQYILPGSQKLLQASAVEQSPAVSSLASFGTPPLSQSKRDSMFSWDSSSGMPYYSLLSPSEILDRHIELGSSVHTKILSR